ncbi:hypothetical protein D1AOALGA4SA_3919 [Olavius algarvensis Delta 1 endosymbiont]|nr:hypothetical protein D1AOALGA4SA_3919 [Olavius algarvensis Delta 1 endosymbiont]
MHTYPLPKAVYRKPNACFSTPHPVTRHIECRTSNAEHLSAFSYEL